MSATPIPRTLTLTVFGDLDLSTITELPAGRKEIITKIVAPENRPKAYDFIKEQIIKGRQAFVICPRIEPGTIKEGEVLSEAKKKALELKSVKEEFEKLSTKIFPDLRVVMLHGKMKGKEKDQIMKDFQGRKYDILISTSVIEVGVDVQNAAIMMIEGSERFGLAQLYQFRGRVGRAEHQSFCLLFTDSDSDTVKRRLNFLLTAKNGFELAEKDLLLRGPGQFLGESQTGLPDIAMDALKDIQLVKTARDAAKEIISNDSEFYNFPALKERFQQFQKEIHLE
jgi:ATP-dependent DNA helicase RecG